MRIKPPALPDGGTEAVVAPSGPPQTRSEIEQATDYFTRRGLNVMFGPHHREVHGYLAGVGRHACCGATSPASRSCQLTW
jgi:muramoyltetrapeptide carboxypeptidase LdcA involved in peptidoglycan recycling